MQKHGITDEEVAEAIHGLLSIATITSGSEIAQGACLGPADDMVLSCALEGRADFIISGDQDLIELESYEEVKIVTPANFLKIITEESSSSGRPGLS